MNWGTAFQAHVTPQDSDAFLDYSQTSICHVDVKEQRKKDEEFITSFVLNAQKRKNNSKPDSINISDGKGFLLDVIKKTEEVKKNIFSLSTTDDEFNIKFDKFEKELQKLNSKIVEFERDVKGPLLKALKKRLKKRKAIKERKLKLKALKKEKLLKIKEKHEMIDKLLLERSEEVESTKREAAFKCQADSVLLEVRRKKNEAKKMLNLLPALAKLRELRSKEEEKIGGYVSKPLTEAFNQVIGRFQNLWERQLEVYKLEEKGLKIMLEENATPCRKPPELETNLLQWEKALFGDVTNSETEKLLTMANEYLEGLIEVRRDWDRFMAADSTVMALNIPLGWVLPPETANEEWKAFSCKKPSQG